MSGITPAKYGSIIPISILLALFSRDIPMLGFIPRAPTIVGERKSEILVGKITLKLSSQT